MFKGEFKAGDRVKYIGTCYKDEDLRCGIILNLDIDCPAKVLGETVHRIDWGHKVWNVNEKEIIKTKEDSMKDRIEALTGWDKEADDIIRELVDEISYRMGETKSYYISI